jgi:glycogen debranching enzyme
MDELVLAEQGVFLTTDARGEIPVGAPEAFGLYYRDTRFLSGFALHLDGIAVPLLGVEDSGYVSTLTYGEIAESPVRTVGIPPNVLVRRTRYLAVPDGHPVLHERIAVTSYNRDALDVALALALAADFKDIFEVRRIARGARPPYQAPQTLTSGTIMLAYTGRDDVRRRTVCHLTPAPDAVVALPGAAVPGNGGDGPMRTAGEPGVTASFTLRLEPRQVAVIEVTIELASSDTGDALSADTPAPRGLTFEEGLAAATATHDAWLAACTRIETDNALVDRVLDRGLRDLRLLLLRFPTGPYLAAGIPWFAVPFGRDALIAALEMLPMNPDIAVGTLRYLAAHQGRRVDPERDEEPGKIMHEMRTGEMVQSGLVPFNPYYGSVDATPLFLVLLGRTVAWLGEVKQELARELEPALRAALAWLDDHGDVDGDGYVEFERKAGRGIANQGWKDSGDSLQFPDGSYPQAPIALVEVQGYVYEARLAAARLLRLLGDAATAMDQEQKAAALRARFDRDFWLADEECYAQALDRDKRPVPAVTSNAGHALWSGIADAERAAALARRLVAPDLCAGWGIRTLSALYPSYNPISYHNGSIWPHDTAIVAAGLKRCGHGAAAATLLEQVVAASGGYADARLPELYGGLPRHDHEHGPVPYPVSCSPQAWAAGSVFLLLQSVLGLEPDADGGALRVRPLFPPGLRRVRLHRLRIGPATVDLLIETRADGAYEVTCACDGRAPLVQTVAAAETVHFPLDDPAQ